MNIDIHPPSLGGARLAPLALELRCAAGPDSEWQVTGCLLSEAIDRPYRARVELAAFAFDVGELLGADCELVLRRGDDELRRLYGVITAIEDRGEFDHQRLFAVSIEPAFALLDQGLNSRIFQDCAVQDILTQVLEPALGDYGREFDLASLSRGTATRDYCVQYQESDYGFVCRLLEEEGIAYQFVHEAEEGVERLTLRDANRQYPEFQNLEGEPRLPLIADRADEADLESVQTVVAMGRLTLTAALRRDFDWLTPNNLLTEPLEGSDERGRSRRAYHHNRRRYISDDLAQQAADRVEAAAVEAALLCAHGNAAALAAGQRFELSDAPLELEGEHLLLAINHDFSSDEDGALLYANELRCIPIAVEYRPALITPKPRVYGPQTAVVVGDDEIHTDEHGRIQVQFHWEEQPAYAAGASCWVRCAQSWAGPGWGAQFIPRVGMEVVVEFLEGNPDRPLVTGCVYNGANGPPFALPNDKTQSGWRTSSSPGENGYNMLRFEDAAGHEEIHIHGQKDWTVIIENDKAQEIRHDESLDVFNDRQRHIGNDERGTIDHDRSITVGNDHKEVIGANQTVEVGAEQSLSVGANQRVQVKLDQTESIGADMTVEVGAAYALSVGEGSSVTVAKGAMEMIGGSKTVIVDASCLEAIAEAKALTAKQLDEDIATDKTVKVGDKLRMIAGKNFGLEAKKYGLVDAGDKLVLSCGKASITLKKNGDIQIKGKTIEVTGTGEVKLKGKKITNN